MNAPQSVSVFHHGSGRSYLIVRSGRSEHSFLMLEGESDLETLDRLVKMKEEEERVAVDMAGYLRQARGIVEQVGGILKTNKGKKDRKGKRQ